MSARPPASCRTQCAAILGRLDEAHGAEVPLHEILPLAAQYNARIWSLRKMGFKIVNRTQEVDGVRYSWFRLVSSPGQVSSPARPPAAERVDNPQPIPRNVKSDPREQLQLFSTKFSTKEDLR
jgi:hypothetical protein